MSAHIEVTNWERFQHYKDRAPPWIKLYNDLLDNYEFACLQDASKMHLVGIWLLASRLNNMVPADPLWIARKIGATEPVDLDGLVSAGFITISQNDSETLARRYQDASPRAQRGEAEGETEVDKKHTHNRARDVQKPGDHFAGLVRWLGPDMEIPLLKLAGTEPDQWARQFVGKWGPGRGGMSTEKIRKGLSEEQWQDVVRDAVGAMALEKAEYRDNFFRRLLLERADDARGNGPKGTRKQTDEAVTDEEFDRMYGHAS